MRIVSLIPEATEILQALGLGDQIVQADLDDLAAARPDLVFTSETEAGGGVPRAAVRRAVAALRPRPAVYALEPHSLGEILGDVKTVGDGTGRQGEARALIEALRERIDAVSLRAALASLATPPPRVVCLQSTDPPVAAGWWLAELIGLAGGLDALDGIGRPPRAVAWEQVQAAQPDLVIELTPALRAGDAVGIQGPHGGQSVGIQGPHGRDAAGMQRPQDGDAVGMQGLDSSLVGLGGDVFPGPGAVALLERMAARILHTNARLRSEPR